MKEILIIGGGAAGMMAAITAAENGAKVTILEQNKRPGKKLLCTGNGKCNLTNIHQDSTSFRGTNPGFAKDSLKDFTVLDTISFFSKLGIYTKNKNGYIYPYSEQAQSVLEVLELKLRQLKVKIKTNETVQAIRKEDRFYVKTQSWEYTSDCVILTTGSCASAIEGSSTCGYDLAASLGHRLVKPLPALVPVKGQDSYYGKWAGVRIEGSITLIINDIRLKSERGELQLTDYGISGIPVFQLSRYIARVIDEGLSVDLEIDFMPDFSKEELNTFMEERQKENFYKNNLELLIGLFPKKLIPVLLLNQEEQNPVDIPLLCARIKHFPFKVDKTLSMEHAQVASGGVHTEDIWQKTMESKYISGLYFAGEVMDIDGACGGYNLQWAWTSGAIAGRNAARE